METTNLSALALIPNGEQWPAIQSLRIVNDREVHKWPPHMNIFYPFLPEQDFEQAAIALSSELAALGPIHIRFCTLGNFGGTVFLKPECQEDPGLEKLHEACKAAFPEIREKHDTFTPHLTIGQFKSAKNAEAFIQKQAALSIETQISSVSLLARDSMKVPFRTPFRVMLGEGGRVEQGDATPYVSETPWRWTCQCLPACTGQAAEGIGGLSRTFSGAASRLLRSVSAGLGGGEPAGALCRSDAYLDERFAESRNGLCDFFTEFRFTDPHLCRAIAAMQEELRQIDPNIYMDQGCAPDNIHFTMNEIQLRSVQDVHRVVDLLQGVASSLVRSSSSAIDLQGVDLFDSRILYVKPAANDASVSLCDVFDRMQDALKTSGFRPRDRGSFVPHATICKSQRGKTFSETFLRGVQQKGYKTKNLGSQPLLEVHFCINRRKDRQDELTPPVLRRLQIGGTKQASSAETASVDVVDKPGALPKRW